MAFQSLNRLLVSCGDPRKVADEISVSPEDSVVFLYRQCQALHVRREQLHSVPGAFSVENKLVVD